MRPEDFDYDLPPELIAQTAAAKRDESRLMIVNRADGTIRHDRFFNLMNYLDQSDLVVFNDTKVRPVRLIGKKASGGQVEVLLLKQTTEGWEYIAKNLRSATQIDFGDGLVGKREGKLIKFNLEGEAFRAVLNKIGHTPIPPYIHTRESEAQLRERYQTVYAKQEGSAAAPTAGLHFTPELLTAVPHKAFVTLHVGLGTFAPLTSENLISGRLHAEAYDIDIDSAIAIQLAKVQGRRIVAVGTTTVRTLETWARTGQLRGETEMFIYPGFEFKVVGGLITNFHLPKSSLMMLVSAFAGRELILRAYTEAVKEKYRFFSFGDAMVIV